MRTVCPCAPVHSANTVHMGALCSMPVMPTVWTYGRGVQKAFLMERVMLLNHVPISFIAPVNGFGRVTCAC